MILGGLVVVALFAALMVPWFINWDDYKANFEAEAEKILGQPVRVVGSAKASILPSPSLAFTQVEVGDTEGQPMMTVDRFAVTIELMPLLQGEIRVISMQIERPVVTVSIDDTGLVDWLIRSDASKALNPDAVILNDVQVIDGTVRYTDARTGVDVAFGGINAQVDARSLAGPWRVEGSFQDNGTPVTFQFATGRRLDDGTIRIKSDVTPARLPLVIAADGVVGNRPGVGLSYAGTYSLAQIVPASADGATGDVTGWRSEGTFTLTRDRLLIDKAVISEGPPDRPSSLAGSMILELGANARFSATAEARQLDLDRSLGEGPAKPVEVGRAAASIVSWIAGLPVPDIPGRVAFNVPGVVVGGAVIQDVRFDAVPEDGGWQVEGLHARLPGQATIQADGTLSTGERVGFGGAVRLTVGQPATFASWWRGRSEPGAGRLLPPFDLAGRATINLGGIAIEDMETRIGDATIRGNVAWTGAGNASPLRQLRTNLSADRLDYLEIKAVAELLAGQNLGDTGALADSYAIRFVADELKAADVTMRNVQVDASFAEGGLTVSGIDIGDIGGARLIVTRGPVDDILTEPRGHLEGQLNAPTVVGLARVIDRLIPDTQFSRWLTRAAPSLAPVALAVTLDSTTSDGKPTSRVVVNGSAAATSLEATVELKGAPAHWRDGEVSVSASLSSYDALGLARQTGLPVAETALSGGARIALTATGIPEQGLATTLGGSFAGLAFNSEGRAALPVEGPIGYAGSFKLESADIAPLIRLTGIALPGEATAVPAKVGGTLKSTGLVVEAGWSAGEVAGHLVGGSVRIAPGTNGWPRVDGELAIDDIDAGWIAALGLGFPPLPTGDPETPWAKAPFGEPVLKGLSGRLDITADRVRFGDATRVTGATAALSVAPNRIDFDIKSGNFIGGTAVGGFSIRNVGGNATVAGRMALVGGALDSIVWQRAGRSVGTGTLDLSASFEATGRSPAALVSSLTGGGTVAIHDGEARYVNPKAVSLVIRSADLGQEFTEDSLRDLFQRFIDADALKFTGIEGAFAIAAGTIRLQNLALLTPEAEAKGSAAIDLNTMSVVSDWTLTLPTGDPNTPDKPQIGIVFSGPLADPVRTLDVLQFSSYLNIRQQERLQEILAMEEAARLEKDRFNRERRKLREDAERAARMAAEAKAARIASATNIEALHVARELLMDQRAATELAAARARAEEIAAAKAEADTLAAEAREAADAARVAAEAAAAIATERTAAYDRAAEAAEAAAGARVAAEAAVTAAEKRAAELAAARDAAEQRSAEAAEAVRTAEAALKAATAARGEADTTAATATEAAESARAASGAADSELARATEAADAASRTSTAKIDTAREAVAALENVYAERTAAEGKATGDEALASALAESTRRSEIETAAAEVSARAAAEALARANAAREAAALTALSAAAGVEQASAAVAAAETEARLAAGAAERAEVALAAAGRGVAEAFTRFTTANSETVVNSTAVDAATAALAAAQQAEESAKREASRLRGEADTAAAAVVTRTAELTAARQIADEAKTDAAETARLAEAAAEADRLAKTDVSTKAAKLSMTRTLAEKAAHDAGESRLAARAKAGAAEAATGAVAELRQEAEGAAAVFDKAREATTVATAAATAARTALDTALAERNARIADQTAKKDAETVAAAGLQAAEAAAAEAATALAAATEVARTAAADAATAKVRAGEAAKAEATALAALEAAAGAQSEADQAAADTDQKARTAEDAARAAAARAAAMPTAWAIPANARVSVAAVAGEGGVVEVSLPGGAAIPPPPAGVQPPTPRAKPAR